MNHDSSPLMILGHPDPKCRSYVLLPSKRVTSKVHRARTSCAAPPHAKRPLLRLGILRQPQSGYRFRDGIVEIRLVSLRCCSIGVPCIQKKEPVLVRTPRTA